MNVTFIVYGKPAPQGSKVAFLARGKVRMKDQNQAIMRGYRDQVTRGAVYALAEADLPRPLAGVHVPVELVVEFMFLRPRS